MLLVCRASQKLSSDAHNRQNSYMHTDSSSSLVVAPYWRGYPRPGPFILGVLQGWALSAMCFVRLMIIAVSACAQKSISWIMGMSEGTL